MNLPAKQVVNSLLWKHVIGYNENEHVITALFNNMRTLKFKAQPTNAFFATVNQMLGGSFQLPIRLWVWVWVFYVNDLTTARSAVIQWKLGGAA